MIYLEFHKAQDSLVRETQIALSNKKTGHSKNSILQLAIIKSSYITAMAIVGYIDNCNTRYPNLTISQILEQYPTEMNDYDEFVSKVFKRYIELVKEITLHPKFTWELNKEIPIKYSRNKLNMTIALFNHFNDSSNSSPVYDWLVKVLKTLK